MVDRFLYILRTYMWLLDPRWLLQSPVCKVERPIFLLGTQGGGLTLLSRMLKRHPKIITVTGNSSYWSGADELANVFGLILPKEFGGMRYKCPPHPVLTGPRSWSYGSDELISVYRKRAADATSELKKALMRIILFSAHRFARDKNDWCFLDKSQTTTVRVGFYFELLKEFNPRFILVPREPYVSVYRAAMGKAGDMRRYMERNILGEKDRIRICAEHLGNSMRAVFEDVDELGITIHVVRFEDLLERPRDSLIKVCDFVGLDFYKDMLPCKKHKLPIGSRFRDRWYPLRKQVNEEYETMISDYLIDCVNKRCGDIIPRMKYCIRSIVAEKRKQNLNNMDIETVSNRI